MKRSFVAPFALLAVCLAFSCSNNGRQAGTPIDTINGMISSLPFEMGRLSLPEIPSRSVSVTDFGAVGDGVQLCTDAFAEAVRSLSEKGGGHLLVPAGVWLTGPIGLADNIDLHLDRNAVILFSPDRDLYPIINTIFEGLDTKRCESPVHAEGCTNVSITGEGVIDGNGDYWRAVKKSKMSSSQWKTQLTRGGVLSDDGQMWYPDAAFPKGQAISDPSLNVPYGLETDEQWNEIKSFLRPVLISLRRCTNVLLEGCTFQNSPCWNIHPLLCKNVIINNITVRNPWYSQNGDGIDIDSCEDVALVNSSFDCGDDGICIKSGKDADGRRRAAPCRNLLIDNCTVYHGHGGFVVGSEMSGGVENIFVGNCRFLGTDVGLRFKSKRGRGGVVRNIYIDNIYMTDIQVEAVLFDLYYGSKSPVEAYESGSDETTVEAMPVDETTPQFRDIYISDIVCNGAARAMFFNGLPEMPVENINIKDCVVSSMSGIALSYTKDVTLENVQVKTTKGEPLLVLNSENLVTK